MIYKVWDCDKLNNDWADFCKKQSDGWTLFCQAVIRAAQEREEQIEKDNLKHWLNWLKQEATDEQ